MWGKVANLWPNKRWEQLGLAAPRARDDVNSRVDLLGPTKLRRSALTSSGTVSNGDHSWPFWTIREREKEREREREREREVILLKGKTSWGVIGKIRTGHVVNSGSPKIYLFIFTVFPHTLQNFTMTQKWNFYYNLTPYFDFFFKLAQNLNFSKIWISTFTLLSNVGFYVLPSLRKFNPRNLKCSTSTKQTRMLPSLKSLPMHLSTSCP